MKYIRLENNIVQEIIPGIDPTFPEFPIEKRYPAKFLSNCIAVADNTEVQQHLEYIAKTGEFKPQILILHNISKPEVSVGEGLPLSFESNTDGAFSYTAENCSYENGMATPIGVGACQITAAFTAIDGRAKTKTVTFSAV